MTGPHLPDPYEVRIGIPTLSWKYARPSEGVRGIILPHEDGAAYHLAQQTDMQGNLLWWAPQGNGERQPRVQQDFLLGYLQSVSGGPIGPKDWISTKATERFDNARSSGDSDALELIALVDKFNLRRQIVKGESLDKGMREAIRSLSSTLGPKPLVGATLEIVLDKLVPNTHNGETKIFALKYGPPTEATKIKVQEFLAARPKKDDPYAETPRADSPPAAEASDDDEPPF